MRSTLSDAVRLMSQLSTQTAQRVQTAPRGQAANIYDTPATVPESTPFPTSITIGWAMMPVLLGANGEGKAGANCRGRGKATLDGYPEVLAHGRAVRAAVGAERWWGCARAVGE